MKKKILMTAIGVVAIGAAQAQVRYLPTGFIQNDSGVKCTYKQRTEPESKYFTESLTRIVGVITFDDPTCMKDTGAGLDTNKMMINNVVSRWYSHSDAAFRTRVSELFPRSMMQKKGVCIQSSAYPSIGITVDYAVRDNSITGVLHGSSIQGCTR